ncbi:unnamed protein product [Lathyrus oleraceus]
MVRKVPKILGFKLSLHRQCHKKGPTDLDHKLQRPINEHPHHGSSRVSTSTPGYHQSSKWQHVRANRNATTRRHKRLKPHKRPRLFLQQTQPCTNWAQLQPKESLDQLASSFASN